MSFEEAQQHLDDAEQVLTEDPLNYYALLSKANSLRILGEYEDSVSSYRMAIEVMTEPSANPYLGPSHPGKGMLYPLAVLGRDSPASAKGGEYVACKHFQHPLVPSKLIDPWQIVPPQRTGLLVVGLSQQC